LNALHTVQLQQRHLPKQALFPHSSHVAPLRQERLGERDARRRKRVAHALAVPAAIKVGEVRAAHF
jgi:hypothetical protein